MIGRTRKSRVERSVREVMDLTPDWLSEVLNVMENECQRRAADMQRDRADRDRYALQAAAIRAMKNGSNLQHNQQGTQPD